MDSKPRLINCHAHIFTGDHVPPYIARTFVPAPLHLLLPLDLIVGFFRWWYKGPATIRFRFWYKKMRNVYGKIVFFLYRSWPLNTLAGYYLFLQTLFILYYLVPPLLPQNSWFPQKVAEGINWLAPWMLPIHAVWAKILFAGIVLLFLPSVRNMVLWIGKRLWNVIAVLPGKQTKELIRRYLNIGRYAFHHKQDTILSRLKSQYPLGTGFVILPMDMDYMEAGNSPIRYRDQMEALAALKESPGNKGLLFPFVFVDPRRMGDVKKEKRYQAGDKPYFNWDVKNQEVVLDNNCFLAEYMEARSFSGFKIYPALGYYPFDIRLLPLWKYAADRGIPILTHCIRGTIFYRGRKQPDWNTHPVFKQAMGRVAAHRIDGRKDGFETDEEKEMSDSLKTNYVPLALPEMDNVDFTANFTHPMNFLCLLEEELLRGLIGDAVKNGQDKSGDVRKLAALFGYTDESTPLEHDLRHLKICLGHFGGNDEWCRYMEQDRSDYSSQLAKHPAGGIRFLKNKDGMPAPGKQEQLWRYTDWYSIICSMMLQYDNVYADISYILHNDAGIFPLLKQTLHNPGLREKVLYGTDFFVVRNHKSDKQMLADMLGGLSEGEFDQIARCNPVKFLSHNHVAMAPGSGDGLQATQASLYSTGT